MANAIWINTHLPHNYVSLSSSARPVT